MKPLNCIKMWHRVFNHMFTRSSFQALPLRLNSFPIASAPRKLHVPRLNSLQGKCFSTSSVVEWKEMDVVAEVAEMIDYTEFVKASISVRAFFMGTSVDVKSLGKKYRRNCVSYPYVVEPPDVVLRFGNTKPRTIGLGAISESDISYMVVFNYGSVILLNVGDSEVNEHLEIVKVHASDVDVTSQWPPVDRDLLPEDAPLKLNVCRNYTRKNGTYSWDISLESKYGSEKALCSFKM